MLQIETSQKARMLSVLTALALLLSAPATSLAQSGSSSGSGGSAGFTQRAEKRAASRWTLQEWLEMKDRNRMMDMWLSMNSPSPYEFMLGGATIWSTRTTGTPATEFKFTSHAAELAAYAQFVGLNFEYENNAAETKNDLTGMLNIRLLGNSLQNSSLTLHAGQRTRGGQAGGSDYQLRQTMAQVSMQLYFSKHFGLDTKYRSYQKAEDTRGDTVSGDMTEAGLFIDFGAVRIFGAWSQEKDKSENTLTSSETTRTNLKSGLKIFY